MGRLVAQEVKPQNIRNKPKTQAWRHKYLAGETADTVNDHVSTRTGETVKGGQVNVYGQSPETAVHEGLHKLSFLRSLTGNTPQMPGKTKYQHDFIEAAEIFDAKTGGAALEALHHAKRRGELTKDIKPHLNAMAAQEYEMGARLMYDPSRGHFARQTVQASLESLADPKGTYIKYRNKQSYVGRGMKEPWELLRK